MKSEMIHDLKIAVHDSEDAPLVFLYNQAEVLNREQLELSDTTVLRVNISQELLAVFKARFPGVEISGAGC